MTLGIRPRAEESVGETINVLGVKAIIVDVVPEDDYHWRVYLSSAGEGGRQEFWEIVIPTDYHTQTGVYAYI